MPTMKFDIKDAEEMARRLGFSIQKVGNRALLATALRIVQHITTYIIPREPRQPVDRGAYRAAWKAKKTADGAQVTNHMPYAAVIEYGAKAGNIKISRVMIEELAEWVMRKGMVAPPPKQKGINAKRRKIRHFLLAEKVAWAIAKSMKKKGIYNGGTGLRVLEKALKIVENAFAQELKTELEREYG